MDNVRRLPLTSRPYLLLPALIWLHVADTVIAVVIRAYLPVQIFIITCVRRDLDHATLVLKEQIKTTSIYAVSVMLLLDKLNHSGN